MSLGVFLCIDHSLQSARCKTRNIRHYVLLMMSCILAHDVYVLLLIASNTVQMVSLQVND